MKLINLIYGKISILVPMSVALYISSISSLETATQPFVQLDLEEIFLF